jgi:hypothetical protein
MPWSKGVMREWQVNVLIKNVTLPAFDDGVKNGTT